MFVWFFRSRIEKFLEIFSPLFNNPSRLFLIRIRSISIITFILQVQTLITISNYAIKLHQRRKLLLDELHTLGILFVSTIRCENRPKSLLTPEKKFQKTFKRQRTRTI
jgi:hypothetical protein